MPIDPVVLPHSFCTFLFPFQFRSEDYEVITTKLEKESHKAKPAWTLHIFQNEDLLPHIANFLNSPANGGGQARRATALSWDLGDNALGHHEFLGARCA